MNLKVVFEPSGIYWELNGLCKATMVFSSMLIPRTYCFSRSIGVTETLFTKGLPCIACLSDASQTIYEELLDGSIRREFVIRGS